MSQSTNQQGKPLPTAPAKKEEKPLPKTPQKKEGEVRGDKAKEEVKVKYVDDINDITKQTERTQYEKVTQLPQAPDLWNNNIIWEFCKGLKPGVDLTRIPFPVCITQDRSFLQNFTDYFEHWGFLNQAANEDDPHKRMQLIIQWYVSGFANAMKVVRKPYNPILGEVFRCMWVDSKNTKTHYIAEQVSHHPPISAFYISSRENGWVGNGTTAFSVGFYGLSAWAYLTGVNHIKLIKYNEDYTWSFPPTKASGFFVGPFMMEMGGEVQIKCEKNPFVGNVNFKVRGFWSDKDLYSLDGKIIDSKSNKVVDTIEGKYFEQVKMNNKVMFDAKKPPESPQRYEVPEDKLWGRESQAVWKNLTAAVRKGDRDLAGVEKNKVEDWQRAERVEDEKLGRHYEPRFFDKVGDGDYKYKYENLKPFEKGEESYEINGIIDPQ